MVLGNENDLALANENESEGDGVVTPGLVDVGRFPPKNISELQSKLAKAFFMAIVAQKLTDFGHFKLKTDLKVAFFKKKIK